MFQFQLVEEAHRVRLRPSSINTKVAPYRAMVHRLKELGGSGIQRCDGHGSPQRLRFAPLGWNTKRAENLESRPWYEGVGRRSRGRIKRVDLERYRVP